MQQKEFTTPVPLPTELASKSPSGASAWYQLGPGIWELLLNGDDKTEKSVLQWYEPGATSITPEVITHEYIEEVVFLSGGLKDVTLGKEWGQGAYAYRFPGMKHGPYVASENGCYQFVKVVQVKRDNV